MEYTSKDLVEINAKIAELELKRAEIMKSLNLQRLLDCGALEGDKKKVYDFISENPGCTRKDIHAILPHLEALDVRYIMTFLRLNRGLIKNQGSRNLSKWYIV